MVRNLSYAAFEEFKALQKELAGKKADYDLLDKKFEHSKIINAGLTSNIQLFEQAAAKREMEVSSLNFKIDGLNGTISRLNLLNSKYEITEEQRRRNYEDSIARLNQLKDTLEKEIKRLSDERLHEQREAFDKMKRQWIEHETSVEQSLKMICQNNFIRYIDNVPFYGNPDNTLEICEEYVIFDAKCPSNDDLNNFPKYIKAQTETVKKYANQDKVKKDIFLVVPTNTIHTIAQLVYNMGEYNVYVITKDALEPIILSLKRIEDYEFVNQLSPEERDNICRVIGKFAHTTKRKIQIDQFFAAEFLELLVRCKNDLPDDILKQVVEFEKAERLNPPSEKKSKQILTMELQDRHASINAEAVMRNVIIPLNFEEMKNLE
ncbi:MAG: hypothetical protein M3Z92_09370, partial [Bacteroidota bacterium]|nr:hypothetical protein [Bacteroidota bacterium]